MSAVAALALLTWTGQTQEPPTAKPATLSEFVDADCPMSFDRVRSVHVDCGYVSVLEDRSKPDGNVIRLAVARLRGSSPPLRPDPVIYLTGGPGISALESIDWFIDDARFIWKERDLILLDYRGIGHSEPLLECPEYRRQSAELHKLDLDPDEELQRQVDALLACKRALSEQGINLSAYTAPEVAADVVDLVTAMGYESYHLFGSSYGTTLALTVMREFPDNLRGVILDGVLPPQVSFSETIYANAAAALEAFFRHCEADRECSRRYPDLEQEFWNVVDRYAERPATTWAFDWHLFENFEEEANGYYVLWRVLESLRSERSIAYLPFLLHHIAKGNDVVADAFVGPTARGITPSTDNTAALALWCYSEGRYTDQSGLLADRAAYPRLVDPESRHLAPALCASWHEQTVEPADRTPVVSDTPTLLLSGQFDPTTPPRWADLAADTLSRSHSFVVPMAGHGVGISTRCGRSLIGAFLHAPYDDPSPACFPIAERERPGFRTIYLNRGMWMQVNASRFDLLRNADVKLASEVSVVGTSIVLTIHLLTLVVWAFTAALRRFQHRAHTALPAGRPRATAAALIAVSVGFLWSVTAAQDAMIGFVMIFWSLPLPLWLPNVLISVFTAPIEMRLMTDEALQIFGYYPWVRPLFVIPYLTAAGTLYVLYLAVRSWREHWWARLGRLHYSIVALTLVWYPLHLVYWGFIP